MLYEDARILLWACGPKLICIGSKLTKKETHTINFIKKNLQFIEIVDCD